MTDNRPWQGTAELLRHYAEVKRRLNPPPPPKPPAPPASPPEPVVIQIVEPEPKAQPVKIIMVRSVLRVVLDVIEERYDLDDTALRSKDRHPHLVNARHLFCYLGRYFRPTTSWPQLARMLGFTDHTSSLHGYKKIARLITEDPATAQLVIELIEQVEARR